MQIKENEQNIELSYEIKAEESLLSVVNEINKELNTKGRIILKIQINGEAIDLNQMNSEKKVFPKDDIEVITSSPIEIAKQSIEEVIRQKDVFLTEIQDSVDQLLKGNKEEAFKTFTVFLEDFRKIIEILQTLEATFSFDYEQIHYKENVPIKEITTRLVDILTELKNAMLGDDMVTMVDILEYEIKEIFSEDIYLVMGRLLELLKNG